MPTIELGRVMPVDKGAWVSDTKYMKMDIVDYNEKSYYCVKSHMSSSSITPEDRTYWIAMTGDGANKVSYDRVVIDRGNLTDPEYSYGLCAGIDINTTDYYKIIAPSNIEEIYIQLSNGPVNTYEDWCALYGCDTNWNDLENSNIIVDKFGIIHPAPQILENGNHLKTIMIDIESTNIGDSENSSPEPMSLDLDASGAEVWGPGQGIYWISWPDCVFWANDTRPEFSGNRCVFLLVSYDGGYTWIGMSSAMDVPVPNYTGPEES